MTVELLINFAVQFLGTGAAFFLAYRSFQKRRIQLGDEPTLPQYFSRRSTYWQESHRTAYLWQHFMVAYLAVAALGAACNADREEPPLRGIGESSAWLGRKHDHTFDCHRAVSIFYRLGKQV